MESLQLLDKENIVLERVYILPLRQAWNSSYHKRTKRAIRIIKEFASRHMKGNIEDVYIDPILNNKIWGRGNSNPPRKIRVVIKKTSKDRILVYDYESYLKRNEIKDTKNNETKDKKEGKIVKSDEKGNKDKKKENQQESEKNKTIKRTIDKKDESKEENLKKSNLKNDENIKKGKEVSLQRGSKDHMKE